MIEGGCRCGAIRYEAEGQHAHHALCHCRDCQMASGAPVLAWLAMPADGFRVTKGEPTRYTAPSGSMRAFCGTCGTPLFFVNEEFASGNCRYPVGHARRSRCHCPAGANPDG